MNKEELDDPIKDWMSLKDYFAAQAIGLFSLSDEELDQIKNKGYAPNHKFVAKFCYDLAEEMLEEKSKRNRIVDNADRLKDQIKYMVEMIGCVVNNQAKEFETSLYFPPDLLKKELEKNFGLSLQGKYESNFYAWAYYFEALDMVKEEIRFYRASGSGYYGGFKFEKA